MRHHDLVGESGKELAKIVEEGPTFVRYHMPGCGHCIAMEKDWDELRNAGHKGIEFVNVESSALAHVPEHLKQGIDGFPMLISYAKGGADRIEYTGERTAKGMEEWLKEHGRIGKQLVALAGITRPVAGPASTLAAPVASSLVGIPASIHSDISVALVREQTGGND